MLKHTMRAPYLVVRFLYFYFSLKYVHVRYSRQSDTDIYLASPQCKGRVATTAWANYCGPVLPNLPCQLSLWEEAGVPGQSPRFSLTILFSHEGWVRVHIKMNLNGDRARNLGGGGRGKNEQPVQGCWKQHWTMLCCPYCSMLIVVSNIYCSALSHLTAG